MDKRTSTNGNKVLGYIAKRIAVRDANTTCPFLGYQPKLPTAVKADSEQRFYVTGTSFNKTGTLNCRSINRNNSAIQSNTASISPSKLSGSASYRSYAPSGQYYYMTTSASVSNLHVTGRYTP